MANTIVTPSIIAKEALVQLKNSCVMANLVHREYKKEFVKVGDTVSIRKPVKFYTADGATRVNQDVEEKTTSITIDQRKHVSWSFSSQDLTLSIEQYSERYIKPAMITLAQTIDTSVLSMYRNVFNSVGAPGTTPSTFNAVAAAAQRLDEMAVPDDMRRMVVNPAASYAIAANKLGLDSIGSTGTTAYEKAKLTGIAGFDMYKTSNIRNHTTGIYTTGSTPRVNGAAQNVTYANATGANTQTIVTDGWANSTAVLKAGDVITLAGAYAVNPVPGDGATSKTAMPYLQEFVVMSDVTSSGAGAATITISPAIITSGPYQTVTAAPADNAVIAMQGTEATAYPVNVGFHKNAFALVTCPLEMPDGAAFKAQESYDGLSVRVVKDYDITNDVDIIRLDVLYGTKAIYPELACRLWG